MDMRSTSGWVLKAVSKRREGEGEGERASRLYIGTLVRVQHTEELRQRSYDMNRATNSPNPGNEDLVIDDQHAG